MGCDIFGLPSIFPLRHSFCDSSCEPWICQGVSRLEWSIVIWQFFRNVEPGRKQL
ncbi:MAG: hypothetical protein HW380_2001 [Magnetococcales bacterium]|nr:hypothetical protein [Magnetococcales bacterium]